MKRHLDSESVIIASVLAFSEVDQGLGFITPGGSMPSNTRLTYGNLTSGAIRDNIKDSRQGGVNVFVDAFHETKKPAM